MKVNIDKIETGDRFREEMGNVDELAESIEEHGLIQPPVVDQNFKLIAGERRLTACKQIGLEEIEVRQVEIDSELKRKEWELQENLSRKKFTWQEEVRAKDVIHEIKKLRDDDWNVEDTADDLDESVGGVSQDIQLANALEEYPELKKADNKSRAWKKYKSIKEQEEHEKLAEEIGEKKRGDLYNLYNQDCLEWMQEQEDKTYDLIVADPPWGIDMDKRRENRDWHSELEYDDNMDELLLLWDDSLKEMHRLMKEDSHLYLFFGIRHYELIKTMIEDAGFEYDEVPLVWNKDHGGSAAKGRTYPKAWESIFFCYKGKRDIKTGRHNVFTFQRPAGEKRIHTAQKSIELLEEFVKNSTNPGDRILDPFAGSGSTVVAGVANNRVVDAVEKEESTYSKMIEWVRNQLAGRKLEEEFDKED